MSGSGAPGAVARPPPRALRTIALLLPLLLAGSGGARAQDAAGPEGSAACGAWAYVGEGDESLRVAYDGLRLGLEEANLARICLERWPADPEEARRALAGVIARRPPFLVALGAAASERLAAAALPTAQGRVPCVYVDVATTVAGQALPPAPRPPLPCGVVRAVTAVEAWSDVLARLLPGRPSPTVLLPWTSDPPAASALRRDLLRTAGLSTRVLADGEATVDAILDWSPGLGEAVEPFEATVARARALRVPVLSADRARFGRGAAVVLVPDAGLLGRSAAEVARRLGAGEGREEAVRLTLRATEVWVDLEAAEAEGLAPPLPFLAAASRLRRPRSAPAAPAPAGSASPSPEDPGPGTGR